VAGPFPVTSTAYQIGTLYNAPYIISNDGLSDIYISGEASVSAMSYGQKIAPGGSIVRDGSQPTWVVSNINETSIVSVLYNATQAATPGPSVVSINQTSKLIKNTPLPPGHALTVQETYTDLGSATAIIIRFSAGRAPVSPVISASLSVDWLDDTGLFIIETFTAICSNAGVIVWNIPRRSNMARLSIAYTDNSTVSNLATYRSYNGVETYTHSFNDTLAGFIGISNILSIAARTTGRSSAAFIGKAAGIGLIGLPTRSGINRWITTNSGNYSALRILDQGGMYIDITSGTTEISGTGQSREVILPNIPIALEMGNTAVISSAFNLESIT